MIFSIKNPVTENAEGFNETAPASGEDMHGIGLMNVRAVVDKYGGDFVISRDAEKFQAVVMI